MKIPRYILMTVLVLSVLFSGCASKLPPDASVSPVEDIFTTPVPETVPQVEMPSFQSVTGITSYGLPEFSLDEVGHYVAYEGGEMRLPYTFTYSGSELSRYGVALMVFLDGQLQPFRTSEEDTLQYVHILYPEEASRDTAVTLDLIFTPMTGQSGDVMDLTILSRELADWEWGSDNVGLSGNSSSITTRLKFSQTPPEATLPESRSRMLNWNCSYADATLAEYESWGKNSMDKLRTCVRIDGEGYGHHPDQSNQGFRYLYDVTEEKPMELTMELVNTSGVEYGVVLFFDNEPISTDPADLIYIDKTSGQRATVSATVDLSGFDGQSKVFAVIIPRNYLSTVGYTSGDVVDVVDTVEYYLFAKSDWAEDEPQSDSMSLEDWQKTWPRKVGSSLGFAGQHTEGMEYNYYIYDGGELHAQLDLQTTGMSEIGTGVFLFLDGRPQPYRLADSDEYAYMHTFYQEDRARMIHDIYLTPVTGQAGDVLEMQVVCVTWPDYFLDQGRTVAQHTAGTTGSSVLVVMESTPEAQMLPSIADRLVSFSVEYKDLKASEIKGWTAEKMRNAYEFHYALAGVGDGGTLYNFQPGGSVEFQYEIWGNTAGSFGFVLFVDNQPVSVAAEDVILFSNENGKKTVITMQLDLSDFDGSSVVYGVLLGRNFLINGIGNGASEGFRETWVPYYLSDAQDIYDLMGWEE